MFISYVNDLPDNLTHKFKFYANVGKLIQAKRNLRPFIWGIKRLGLTGLKTRREREDFIQIYKIEHSLEKVNWCDENKILRPDQKTTDLFQLSRERRRGNELRTHFLFNRMTTP